MGLVRKAAVGLGLLVILAGGVNYFNKNTKIQEEYRTPYRGYNVFRYMGFNQLVFGKEKELRVVGEPDNLKINEEYDVKYRVPRWFGEKILVSAEPSENRREDSP